MATSPMRPPCSSTNRPDWTNMPPEPRAGSPSSAARAFGPAARPSLNPSGRQLALGVSRAHTRNGLEHRAGRIARQAINPTPTREEPLDESLHHRIIIQDACRRRRGAGCPVDRSECCGPGAAPRRSRRQLRRGLGSRPESRLQGPREDGAAGPPCPAAAFAEARRRPL